MESHKEYERITEQVEVEMSSRNLEEFSGRDPEEFSDSLTRAFLVERNRMKEQNLSDQQFFRYFKQIFDHRSNIFKNYFPNNDLLQCGVQTAIRFKS